MTIDKSGLKLSSLNFTRHLMSPVDALLCIYRLKKALDGCDLKCISFCLGISHSQLNREINQLKKCLEGDPDACANYNSRSRFMRMLFLLDTSSEMIWEKVISDIKHFGQLTPVIPEDNVVDSAKGITPSELALYQQEVRFLEEEHIQWHVRKRKFKRI